MTRFLTTLLVLATLLGSAAEAQTYVRPSKGKAFTVTLTSFGATPAYSAVYDWTAFEAARLSIHGDSCSSQGALLKNLTILGGNTSTGALTVISDPGNTSANITAPISTPATVTMSVSNLPPFLQFKLSGTANCTATVTIEPVPFNITRGVRGATAADALTVSGARVTTYPIGIAGYNVRGGDMQPISIRSDDTHNSGGTQISMLAAEPSLDTAFIVSSIAGVNVTCTGVAGPTRWASIQNLSTVVVYCGFSAGCTNVPAGVSVALNAGSTNNDGTGGSATFSNISGSIYCVSSSGTVNVAVSVY